MVMPGAAPGGPLVIRAELDRRHTDTGISCIRTGPTNTPDEIEAIAWAADHGVPLNDKSLPNTVLLAHDLTAGFFPMPNDANRIWDDIKAQDTLSLQDKALNVLTRLAGMRVIWLNTGHCDVVRRLRSLRE